MCLFHRKREDNYEKIFSIFGCGEEKEDIKGNLIKKFGINDTDEVTLNFYGNLENFPSLQDVINSFNEYFPNCRINYVYKGDYTSTMGSLLKDSEKTKEINLYLSTSETTKLLQTENLLDVCSVNYYDETSKIDISSINRELCLYNEVDGKLYDVPSMVNARGMCVNKTLLKNNNLEVPKNWNEFMNCCEVLKQNNLLPIQCNPSIFGVCLIYPKIACDIVYSEDFETIFPSMNNFDEGSGQYLKENFNKLLTICDKGYYDYESNKGMTDNYTQTILEFFEGDIAFLPCTIETFSGMKKREANFVDEKYGATKYNGFEYEYMGSPVGDGTYIYWMPYNGISINPQSNNYNYTQAFTEYLFREENLQILAKGKGMYSITKNNSDPKFDITSKIEAPYQTNQGRFTITYFSEIKYAFEKMYKKDAKVCDDEGKLNIDKVVAYFESKISAKKVK